MRNVVEFCTNEDPNKPDFLGRLVDDGIIRRECAPPENAPMTDTERNTLKNQVE